MKHTTTRGRYHRSQRLSSTMTSGSSISSERIPTMSIATSNGRKSNPKDPNCSSREHRGSLTSMRGRIRVRVGGGRRVSGGIEVLGNSRSSHNISSNNTRFSRGTIERDGGWGGRRGGVTSSRDISRTVTSNSINRIKVSQSTSSRPNLRDSPLHTTPTSATLTSSNPNLSQQRQR
jgi:hypothetical protein